MEPKKNASHGTIRFADLFRPGASEAEGPSQSPAPSQPPATTRTYFQSQCSFVYDNHWENHSYGSLSYNAASVGIVTKEFSSDCVGLATSVSDELLTKFPKLTAQYLLIDSTNHGVVFLKTNNKTGAPRGVLIDSSMREALFIEMDGKPVKSFKGACWVWEGEDAESIPILKVNSFESTVLFTISFPRDRCIWLTQWCIV